MRRAPKNVLHTTIALVASILAVASIVGCFALRDHDAFHWSIEGPNRWPRYACVHDGRVMVLSSVWEGGLSSDQWMADYGGCRDLGLALPRYTLVGDTYGGEPAFKSLLYAASVPIWYAAVPLALIALHQLRGARKAANAAVH